ncbi:hypothetical protein VIGAN_01183500, partial [Vigna angularis var. angularis]
SFLFHNGTHKMIFHIITTQITLENNLLFKTTTRKDDIFGGYLLKDFVPPVMLFYRRIFRRNVGCNISKGLLPSVKAMIWLAVITEGFGPPIKGSEIKLNIPSSSERTHTLRSN